MFDSTLETLTIDDLEGIHGGCSTRAATSNASGMSADARWIMMHESGGNSHAKNPTSSAFGAFQMIKANRKHYMGANWQSTDLNLQYKAATRYVNERYGGWSNAKHFWQKHHWY